MGGMDDRRGKHHCNQRMVMGSREEDADKGGLYRLWRFFNFLIFFFFFFFLTNTIATREEGNPRAEGKQERWREGGEKGRIGLTR